MRQSSCDAFSVRFNVCVELTVEEMMGLENDD